MFGILISDSKSIALCYLCSCDESSPQGGTVAQGMTAEPVIICVLNTPHKLLLAIFFFKQGMCWASSTPRQRTSSSARALMPSSLVGVSWRRLIGSKLLSCTESPAGRPTQRDWARKNNKSIFTVHFIFRLLVIRTSADELEAIYLYLSCTLVYIKNICRCISVHTTLPFYTATCFINSRTCDVWGVGHSTAEEHI